MQNKRFLGLFILLCISFAIMQGQNIEIKDFKKLHHTWFQKKTYTTQKQKACLDFFTLEDGFTFLANGKDEIAAEKGNDRWSLEVPHHTRSIVIKHEKLGQITWLVPGKPLRKKKHYEASLNTLSWDEAYELDRQWLVFHLSPQNALLWVDSIPQKIRTGMAQLQLPLGRHTYKVATPFYEEQEDTLVLSKESRKVITVNLQPTYAFLSVHTDYPSLQIYIDGEWAGKQKAVSGRLSEGIHHVRVMQGKRCYYEDWIHLGKAEKRLLKLEKQDFVSSTKRFRRIGKDGKPMEVSDSVVTTPVELATTDSTYQILINREALGEGSWQGELPEGDYAIQTRKDSIESSPIWVHAEHGEKQIWNLPVPETGYGTLSIHCNEIDAEIWIARRCVGLTPYIVEQMPAGKPVSITLRKKGFKEETQTVVPPVNNIMNVTFKLKKDGK